MTDPNSKPALVSAAAEFDRLAVNNPEVIDLLHELADNAENPDYQPRTYGEVFMTEDGIRVGDTIYPADFPGLAEKPIVHDDYKAPSNAVNRLALQMQRASKRLSRALNTFQRRSTQRAKAHVRGVKGGKRIVDEHNYRLEVSKLRPFAGPAPVNSLSQGKRGFDVSIGTALPTITEPLFKLPKTGEGFERKLQRKLQEACQSYGHNLLDHTQSVVMASSTVTGHDKVSRLLQLNIVITTDDGTSYESTYTQINQKRGVTTSPIEIPSHEGPMPGSFQISGQLSYEFRCSRSKVPEVTEVLKFLEDLPIFRNVSGVVTSDALTEMPGDDDLFGEIELSSEDGTSEATSATVTVSELSVTSTMSADELAAALFEEEDASEADDSDIPQAALDMLAQFESVGAAPELPQEDATEDATSYDETDEVFGFDFSVPETPAHRAS